MFLAASRKLARHPESAELPAGLTMRWIGFVSPEFKESVYVLTKAWLRGLEMLKVVAPALLVVSAEVEHPHLVQYRVDNAITLIRTQLRQVIASDKCFGAICSASRGHR